MQKHDKEVKLVGYWNDQYDARPGYIYPREIQDESNYAPYKSKVISYLRSGKLFRTYMGYAESRLPNTVPPERLGCCDLTDGEWVWPEGLDAYVELADILLPSEFIRTMKNNGFKVPDIDGEDLEAHSSVSNDFWLRWCHQIRLRTGQS